MNGSINFDGTLSGSIAGGGGGGGSEVTITPVVTEGTKIADYSIDSTTGELYAPEAGDIVEVTPTLNVGDKVADIEVNGVNKALYSQSYDYANDMHDTNSETIGGLQKGSNITPIMVKAVSYADQSGVDGETIGVLSVGDTDYLVKQKKASMINYSLTEQDTGLKWIDGRSIYQKTFDLTIGSTSGLQAFNVDLPCDFCIHTEQSIMGEGERGFTVWASSAYIILSTVGNNIIEYYFGSSNYAGRHIYITVYYCKAVV